MGVLGLNGSRSAGFYGSGATGSMKVDREVVEEWRSSGTAGCSKQLALLQGVQQAGKMGGGVVCINLYRMCRTVRTQVQVSPFPFHFV